MISLILQQYSNEKWHFLDIPDEELRMAYNWINIYFPKVDLKFPWAIRDDILRLFLLSNACSEQKTLDFLTQKLGITLEPVQIELIEFFAYPSGLLTNNLDNLIENSETKIVLNFIYETLERALMWQWLDPCWPSDFHTILATCKGQIDKQFSDNLVYIETSKPEGVDFVSAAEHTHVFYKFKDLCQQLASLHISYNITTLAMQAHEALIASLRLRLEFNTSILNELKFDKKIDEIIEMETKWCVSRILKNTNR